MRRSAATRVAVLEEHGAILIDLLEPDLGHYGADRLDRRIEVLEVHATGEISEDLIQGFASAKERLYKTPCPFAAPVDYLTGLRAVHVNYYSSHGPFGFTAGVARAGKIPRR